MARPWSPPPSVSVEWPEVFRIISSQFPPVNVFEDIYETAEEMEWAFAIEGMTNLRLRQEAGELFLVPPEDWIWGPGASVIMACFTHIGRPSRFSDGSFGVYYGAESLATAVAETKYHRERFLASTREEDIEITLRVYVNRVRHPLLDVRDASHRSLGHPDDYGPSQLFGISAQQNCAWGIVYRSVRRPTGECVAVLRPPALTLPVQAGHLRYVWSGKRQRITDVYRLTTLDTGEGSDLD